MDGAARPGLAYAALFLILMWPRLASFATHLPTTPNANDAQLIVWILSWVEHAVRDAGATIFDANINYPAPAQLTGSDYFLSSQILFAPLVWLTGNPVLAVNTAALVTYWLAALACERLLRALGCGSFIAFVAGLSFALGPLRVPFNVHVLQYPSFLYPLLALALIRLREQPDLRRMLRVAATFALGLLASLYAAVMLGVVGLVWAVREIVLAGSRRLRYLALGAAAAAIATLPLLPVLHVYLSRAGHQAMATSSRTWTSSVLRMVLDPVGHLRILMVSPVDAAFAAMSLVGVLAWLGRDPFARRVVPVGIALFLAGDALSAGTPPLLDHTFVADWFRFLRYPHRFLSVTHFGSTLLLAAGLMALVRWTPRWLGAIVTIATLLAILIHRGAMCSGPPPLEVGALTRDREVHLAIGALTSEHGRGPLLVLPTSGRRTPGDDRGHSLEPDTMLASTLHWLPLLNGYTGYQPEHRLLLVSLVIKLPDQGALEDLVDVTHLRWILLRPPAAWGQKRRYEAMDAGLRASPYVSGVWEVNDWTLFEIGRAPRHSSWFEAIARGTDHGTTVLGTPIAALPEGTAIGAVQTLRQLPDILHAKKLFFASLSIANRGTAVWPTQPPPVHGLILDILAGAEVPRSGSVLLVERWWPLDTREVGGEIRREIRLRRDLAPGESIEQKVPIVTPAEPGRYELEISLEQVDGARFDGPGNDVVRHEMVVLP